MSELARGVVATAIKPAINYDPTCQTGAHTHIQKIAHVSVLSLAMPDFCQRRTARGVVDDYRETCSFFQQMDHWHIAPRQHHGEKKLAGMIIYKPRQAHSDSRELDKRVVFRTKLANFLSDLIQKCSCVRPGFITNSSDDAVVEVTQRQDRFVGSTVDPEQSESLAVKAQGRG